MENFSRYKVLIYKIIGAAMKVHQTLSFGLLESIYQEALVWELSNIGIDAEKEKELDVYYGEHLLEKKFRIDLVVGDIICELKVVNNILPEHRAQLCNYLRLTKKPVGLLINFGANKLFGERWVYNQATNQCLLVDINMNPIENIVDINFEGYANV